MKDDDAELGIGAKVGIVLASVSIVGVLAIGSQLIYLDHFFDRDYKRDVRIGSKDIKARVIREYYKIFTPYIEIVVSEENRENIRYVDEEPYGNLDYMEILKDDGSIKICFDDVEFGSSNCPNSILDSDKKNYIDLYNALY